MEPERKRRDPVKPEPKAKRGKQDKQYRTREERETFQLGSRAKLKGL